MNFDQKHGVEIMRAALAVPCKTIAQNAGAEGAVVVGKLLEQVTNRIHKHVSIYLSIYVLYVSMCVCIYLHVSCKTIAQNAGAEGAVAVGKLRERYIYIERNKMREMHILRYVHR